jgi:galactofuranose transport system substrate-binding protein
VELRGTENSTPALGRSKGFREVIQQISQLEIVYSEDGDFINSKGKEIMKDVIDSKIAFDVIYSHNDSMTYGAIEVLEAAGIQPGKQVIIISVDGEQKSIELLREGKINCVVECTPMIGDKLMEVSQKILKGESVPKNIFSHETVFTMWDDLSLLEQRGY